MGERFTGYGGEIYRLWGRDLQVMGERFTGAFFNGGEIYR
jgi:hypothetical protein